MKKRLILLISLFLLMFVAGCEGKNDKHDCLEFSSDWITIGEITCGTTTKQQKICDKCKEIIDERTIETNHEYECVVVKEATCDADGETKYTCKHCNDSYTETKTKIGHEYECVVVKEATCDADGETKYTCKHCNDSYTIQTKATGHDYEKNIIADKSCGVDGEVEYKCINCDDSYKEIDKATEHNYESKVLKQRSCTVNGEVEYKCINCDYSYVETEYATGHKEGEIKVVIQPTSSTLGTKRSTCQYCNYVYKEFNFVDNAYNKNGKLSVNGRDLVNQYGEKYQLYGLSTHGLQWFSKVVNFDTICKIQENFGNNVIRFALYTDEDGYCSGSEAVRKQMLETIERGIQIATELGLYVIVDWHMVGAENVADKNPLTYLKEAKEFFSYISEKYKNQNNIIYEIMNEPNGSTTWADCKKYANEVIPCIRKNTDAIILVGNPKWTADLNSVMKDPLVGYSNIMYTYHFYAADHSSTTQVVNAYDKGFPVFISEFGFMDSSGDGAISTTNGDKWKKVLDDRNISYVAWNISNSKGSASIFKYGTSNLSDVSDSNLKEWGVYLKNWYRSKSLQQKQESEDMTAVVELMTEVPDWSTSYECFIVGDKYDSSRLNYEWSSTNESVLIVSEYSTITIKGNGTCSIICKHKTSSYVGILDIEVKNGEIVKWESRYKG